jgi:hypothetical protein
VRCSARAALSGSRHVDLPVEGVVGRIDVGGHLRQLLAVGLHGLRRDAAVLGAEVEDGRGLERLVEELDVARTVVAEAGRPSTQRGSIATVPPQQ